MRQIGVSLGGTAQGSSVRLLSRNQRAQNAHYPELVAALAALPVGDAILDGEALGVWGSQRERPASRLGGRARQAP